MQLENPKMSHVEIMQNLSKCWKCLSEEERTAFEESAKIDKERYQNDVMLFDLEFQKMKKQDNELQLCHLKNQNLMKNKEENDKSN